MTASEEDAFVAPGSFPALLPWQRAAAREALAQRATFPHALLIQGPAGVGKHVLALHFAQALLCESPRPDGFACGGCAGCRYVAAGQHPDLRRIEPVDVDDEGVATPRNDIPIDAIRALIAFAQVTAHRRIAKVALIAPAERMNPSAANALLKTLEEPPAGTYLLLSCGQPGRLPATVRSRCRVLEAPLPSEAEALAWLSAAGVRNPGPVLAQAGGAPLAALALADSAVQSERLHWLAALAKPETLSPVALGARLDAAPKDERRDRLAAAVDWLAAWAEDLARVSSGGEARRNPDFAVPLGELAGRVARISLLRYHRRLLRHRAWIHHPLQPRLVVEALLIDYRALFT